MMQPDWYAVLAECRRNFGRAPRRFSWWDSATFLRVPKPSWMFLNRSDKLGELFKGKRELFKTGHLVWGHVIQANSLLMEPGTMNCPGEMVYPADANARLAPENLNDIARGIFGLKGTQPEDRKLRYIAHYLTNETTRVYGLPVPHSISPDLDCLISTTFFVRHHLPGRLLNFPILPLVVSPSEPRLVLPVPARYWPKQFVEWWSVPN